MADIGEEYTPYSDRAKGLKTDDDDPLVQNAADMGRSDKTRSMGDLGNGDPLLCRVWQPLGADR